MWAEARKHEKKIRGIVIDLKKRAERRKAYYEAIKDDPVSYLRIHGQGMKVHLDPKISEQANACMMPWPGSSANSDDDEPKDEIDRFDVRVHLESIPIKKKNDQNFDNKLEKDVLSEVQYERYRELIHNDFRAVDQKQVLSEIQQEESFEKMARKLDKKREQRAAINVQYNQGEKAKPKDGSDSDDSGSDSDPGIALLEDVMNPSLLSEHDQSSVDNKAMDFGIASGMFIRYLRNDRRFLDSKRQKQKEDIEHAMSGEKKSRRGRRILTKLLSSNNAKDAGRTYEGDSDEEGDADEDQAPKKKGE